MTYENIAETAHSILQEIDASLQALSRADIATLVDAIADAKQVFLVGAGRSRILLEAFCMRLNHLGFKAYMAGGLPCPPAGEGDLIVASSGSGTSGSVISVLTKGRSSGARVIMFTASSAELATLQADVAIRISAPNGLVNPGEQRSMQPMRSLFEQTVFVCCEAVVSVLKSRTGISDEAMAQRHANLE